MNLRVQVSGAGVGDSPGGVGDVINLTGDDESVESGLAPPLPGVDDGAAGVPQPRTERAARPVRRRLSSPDEEEEEEEEEEDASSDAEKDLEGNDDDDEDEDAPGAGPGAPEPAMAGASGL